MTIERWKPRCETTKQEDFLLGRLGRTRKLFRFLREHRHEIFNEGFQDELAAMYRATGAGIPAKPPALMAMATLLQGYVGASDAEAVEMTVVDLRWQMNLDCLGATEPAFSQGTLYSFRHRMIENNMDRRLLERTAEVARKTKGFDPKKLPKLRTAVDSAPLAGAGRVEDTVNLLAHAARKIIETVALVLEREPQTLYQDAGIPLLAFSSAKRGLDRKWAAPGERDAAVKELVEQVETMLRWVGERLPAEVERPPLQEDLDTLHQIIEQDLEPDPSGDGSKRIRDKVAKDRRISIEDGEMRHGRKSSSRSINGFKRHIAKDLDSGVIDACALTPANEPEEKALEALNADIEAQGLTVGELYIDRGYVGSPIVGVVTDRGGEVVCRPWTQFNRGLYTKEDFSVQLDAMTATCPAGHSVKIRLGASSSFPVKTCDACELRAKCTTVKCGRGRSIRIAKDEALQQRFRKAANTPDGRARLRKRVPVEHSLAHVVQRQGRRARYLGTRNNLFDLRRACSIQNLETAQREFDKAA